MKRGDDFQERRSHLANLNEEELEKRFWMLAEEIVTPMIDLAKGHTTPSIERSVLMRMGFSSLEAKSIVEGVMDRGLMGKGAGHVVYRLAREKEMDLREAGLQLSQGKLWNEAAALFEGVSSNGTKA